MDHPRSPAAQRQSRRCSTGLKAAERGPPLAFAAHLLLLPFIVAKCHFGRLPEPQRQVPLHHSPRS